MATTHSSIVEATLGQEISATGARSYLRDYGAAGATNSIRVPHARISPCRPAENAPAGHRRPIRFVS